MLSIVQAWNGAPDNEFPKFAAKLNVLAECVNTFDTAGALICLSFSPNASDPAPHPPHRIYGEMEVSDKDP
jgi:hypothetical protein